MLARISYRAARFHSLVRVSGSTSKTIFPATGLNSPIGVADRLQREVPMIELGHDLGGLDRDRNGDGGYPVEVF